MSIKTASLIALVGMIVLTALLLADFLTIASGWIRDIVPAAQLLRSFVYLLASLTVTLYFFVLNRSQS